MENVKVIESGLVPVYETSTGEKVVYGTELQMVLGVKSKYADWVKNRLKECDALENVDFQAFSKILEKGGRPTIDYIIKLDTAKEMAMLERNEKGKQVRRYFIQVEKKYLQDKQQKKQANTQNEIVKAQLAEAKLRNARAKEATVWLKLAQLTDIPVHKQICASYASGVLNGSENVLPLPSIPKTYTATQIGELLGVSANKIGRLSEKYHLKTPELGIEVMDIIKHSNKNVPSFRYYEKAIARFKESLEDENKAETLL